MKILLILLSSLVFNMSAFADDHGKAASAPSADDSATEATPIAPDGPNVYKGNFTDDATEAVSVKGGIGCQTGFCPNPVDNKQATLTDQQNARNIVNWIMNNGTGKPPELGTTEGKR